SKLRVLSQPSRQLLDIFQAGKGRERDQVAPRPVTHRDRLHPGVCRHLKIVHCVSDHKGIDRVRAEFLHELAKHVGRRLRCALVGAARGGKQWPQTRIVQGPRQARSALSGGDGENMTTGFETASIAWAPGTSGISGSRARKCLRYDSTTLP